MTTTHVSLTDNFPLPYLEAIVERHEPFEESQAEKFAIQFQKNQNDAVTKFIRPLYMMGAGDCYAVALRVAENLALAGIPESEIFLAEGLTKEQKDVQSKHVATLWKTPDFCVLIDASRSAGPVLYWKCKPVEFLSGARSLHRTYNCTFNPTSGTVLLESVQLSQAGKTKAGKTDSGKTEYNFSLDRSVPIFDMTNSRVIQSAILDNAVAGMFKETVLTLKGVRPLPNPLSQTDLTEEVRDCFQANPKSFLYHIYFTCSGLAKADIEKVFADIRLEKARDELTKMMQLPQAPRQKLEAALNALK